MGAGDEHSLPLMVIYQRRQQTGSQFLTRKSPWYVTRRAELE